MRSPALLRRLLPSLPSISLAIAFRWACYVLMIAMCLWAERRPAPHLPDLVIDRIPYQAWVARWNYWLLILCYVPVSLALLLWEPRRFCRYSVSTGLLSLCRGLCIMMTGLGPVRGPDVNAGLGPGVSSDALWRLSTPLALVGDAPQIYLTKDLFFSGHTGVTFLILLYVWPRRALRWFALGGHLVVVASVFLSHLHYTIDVVGAYAIAFSIFVLREGRLGDLVNPAAPPAR